MAPMAKPLMPTLAAQLLAPPFTREGTQPTADPLVDTYLQVSLEQVRPFHLDPRRTPNPKYAQIKASIQQRGLDQPPSITRRPGEAFFIIRNGGNTRLAILNELWQETGEERFHSLLCLFRPWTARGEILALAGHLAENELRGCLTFIERSQAVDQARQLYEQECGHTLNQRELAERLTADGYPIDQPAISRMGDTLEYLLPAIPEALRGGLGRPQIRKLLLLRKCAQRVWQQHDADADAEFTCAFNQSLAQCDSALDQFSVARARDELIGNLAQRLDLDYDQLALDLGEKDLRQQMLGQLLTPQVELPRPEPKPTPLITPPPDTAGTPASTATQQVQQRLATLVQHLTSAYAPLLEVTTQHCGLGFACRCAQPGALPPHGQALLTLLQTLCGKADRPAGLRSLLCGTTEAAPGLDDATLAQLFQVIKFARQLAHSGA